MKIKNRIITLATVLVCLVSFMNTAFAADGVVHWYVKNNKDHRRPALEGDLSLINGHNASYIGADEKVIYLTFDAGYENGNVARILDTLKKHDVKAAFFVLENLIKRDTDLVKRMASEGHLVCNHTASHKNMSLVTDKNTFASELEALEKVYTEYTGNTLAKYYRPPEGSFNESNLIHADELGYHTVFWSFAYADWDNNKQPDTERALDKIMSHIHNGEIMLLHPTSATNAAILDTLLTRLKSEGYRFGTLDELRCTS
ncbi:MAG: polysaccharide deacetylase family protein [Clostridia bacterium]|nr:polysaccharide deacetylase family protein [Clostridia bacterium]